jgi:beta-lactam-binding protein with PASTA domain
VTLTAVAATGSTFEGWAGACSGKATCTVAMTAAVSVKASFLKDCVVPRIKGKGLKAAETAIKAHGCLVGKIQHAFSRTTKKGHVISQKPKPGEVLAPGAKVDLVVSKGKHRRR